MNKIEKLLRFIQFYLNQIEDLYLEAPHRSYGQVLYQLGHVLLYLDIHADAIHRTKNYVPSHEIEMITSILHSLPACPRPTSKFSQEFSDSISIRKEQEIQNILMIIKKHMLNFQILLSKLPKSQKNDELIQKVIAGITQIDKFLLEQFKFIEKNSDQKDQDESKPPIQFLEHSDISSLFPGDTSTLLPHIEKIKDFFQAEFSDEKLKKSLESKDSFLINIFVILNNYRDSNNLLLKLIEWLHKQSTDKKEFALLCLNHFRDAYKNHSARSSHDSFIQLLSILDKSLAEGELAEIIKKVTQTSNMEAYHISLISMKVSLYLQEKSLHMVRKFQLHMVKIIQLKAL